jgi:ribosomal protein S18 acetylase RimI-like enzyme
MLIINKIKDIHSPHFTRLYDLYQSAFASNERRTYDGLVAEMMTEPKFHSLELLKKNEWVGFLNYWVFEEFWYIEHFAVEAHCRNQQIGTQAMKLFMEVSPLPILFEVELPVNDFAKRRICFYERLGFSVLSNKYAQPPYIADKGDFIPELIMCNDLEFASTNFELIKKRLYQEVYHYH